MPLEPLQQVLTTLKKTQWQHEQEFGKLLAAWTQLVGSVVAAQAQPIQITPQKVLLVATSSSVWAQNLAFERRRLLHKLNDHVKIPFTDIRFSTRQWPLQSCKTRRSPSITPFALPQTFATPRLAPSPDPNIAFDRWSQTIRTKVQNHPTCPTCLCPTPLPELQRWSVCSLCAVRDIEQPKRPPD